MVKSLALNTLEQNSSVEYSRGVSTLKDKDKILVEVNRWILVEIKIKQPIKRSLILKTIT